MQHTVIVQVPFPVITMLASFPGQLRFISQLIFLQGCVIKFGNGLGMRLLSIIEGDPVIVNARERDGVQVPFFSRNIDAVVSGALWDALCGDIM